jgi:REP element-mobilizing transposase RayT
MIFVEALLQGESVRRFYDLHAWVVTPNHVQVVMKSNSPLPEVMRWLKTATANRANRLLGTTGGAFWQGNDRWIRSDEQLASAIAYVEENPVRSGLAAYPEAWR